MGRYILGFDLETTGLDPKTDRIIEVGAVLWDWDRQLPIDMISKLCWHTDDGSIPQIPELITKLTGITGPDLKEHAISTALVLQRFMSMTKDIYIMAHNAPFDISMLAGECEKLGLQMQTGLGVLDSRVDIAYDKDLHKSRALVHLAASHGFLNPFTHRAVFDVLTMLRVASNYDLDEIIARSKSPNVILTAHVSFDERDLAKAAGFHWKPEIKSWQLSIKECDLKDDMGFGFRTSAEHASTGER